MSIFAFYGISYLIRVPAVSTASRPREIYLPLLCSILPFGIYESYSWSFLPWIQNYHFLQKLLMPFASTFLTQRSLLITFVIISGNALSLAAIVSLKKSFSILTEARALVTTGVYRWVRHPLYIGESLTTLGCCLYLPSWFNVFLTVFFFVLILLRAKFEEGKMIEFFPEYQEYKARVFPV